MWNIYHWNVFTKKTDCMTYDTILRRFSLVKANCGLGEVKRMFPHQLMKSEQHGISHLALF